MSNTSTCVGEDTPNANIVNPTVSVGGDAASSSLHKYIQNKTFNEYVHSLKNCKPYSICIW